MIAVLESIKKNQPE